MTGPRKPSRTAPTNRTAPPPAPRPSTRWSFWRGCWSTFRTRGTSRRGPEGDLPAPRARSRGEAFGLDARGVQPRWSSDGRRLYFRSPQAVLSAELQFRDGTAVVTRRDSLFADRFTLDEEDTYDVLPDGSGFVFLRGPAETRQQQRLMLIANWPALLRAEPKER